MNSAAQVSGNDREIAIGMLGATKDEIKKNYYDPTFHGVDIDFVFDQAKERMKAAPTRDALMMTIASAVLALDDSHTTFFPPARAAEIEYGWNIGMIGEDCFVTQVKPGSDAQAKGLKIGDKILAIDGVKPTRQNLWKMYYRYFLIAPTARVTMNLLTPGEEKPHTLEVLTRISKTASVVSLASLYERGVIKKGWDDTEKVSEFQEVGKDLLIWRMHTFSQSPSNIDRAISLARGHKSLILDLRDNGGGSVEILKRVIGSFFDKEIKIADEKTKKDVKPMVAKSRGSDVFKGELIVLVGHESASASELFARTIQLEKRGKVFGDKTAGAVMESKFHDLGTGIGNALYYGTSVTMADIIMPDGKSLEKQGVIPDETILPTGKDLAERKDPLMSYAAKQLGVEISAEKAGKFFPFEWPK
jgi:C-terminal processing protease CtpA/Prc